MAPLTTEPATDSRRTRSRGNGIPPKGYADSAHAIRAEADVRAIEVSAGSLQWEMHVERGPDCLIVKLGTPSGQPWEMGPLADTIRSLLDRHFTYRLILDMKELTLMSSMVIGQLVMLRKWICAHRGVMCLCGMSPLNLDILRRLHLLGFFSIYRNCQDAVSERRDIQQPVHA